MLICSPVALVINFPNQKAQGAVLGKAAPVAFNIIYTIFGLGFLMGVLGNTGMLGVIAKLLTDALPKGAYAFIPLILALVGFWIVFALGSSIMCAGILPIMTAAYAAVGGAAVAMGAAALLSFTPMVMMGPFAVMSYTVCQFAQVEYTNHTKYTLKWLYLMVVITTILMVVFGIIPLSI